MEVIRFGEKSSRPPLLFVHGSYCGAWIWAKFFLPEFARQGWWGAAISLKGHGASPGIERLSTFGIADFVEDIAAGVALFDEPPVLIGHSLGGYLVQKYALDHAVRGLVLMSSPSLMGLGPSGWHIASFHPALAAELAKLVGFGPAMVDQQVIVNGLFSTPEAAAFMAGQMDVLQGESSRVSVEAAWPDWRRPSTPPPTLVIGGDDDSFVPVSDFKYEVSCWNGDYLLIPGAPHGVMVDPCWPAVAGSVIGWLQHKFGASPSP